MTILGFFVLFVTICSVMTTLLLVFGVFTFMWGSWLDRHRTAEDDAEADEVQLAALRQWELDHPNAKRWW